MTVLEQIQEAMREDENLDVDAYGTAVTVIRLVAMAALSSPSMGAGLEQFGMNSVLNALRED